MEGKTYEVKIKLFVSKGWEEDGLDVFRIQQKIKDGLADMLCQFAYEKEIKVINVEARILNNGG